MTDRPRWTIEGRDWPNRAASGFVDAARLRWHVQQAGSGPVILLLHGTGAATHSWRDVLPILAERFTVVAPDLPGHGFTTGRPDGGLSMSGMARAVAGLTTALGIAPVAVVGHSAGAAIAARAMLDGAWGGASLIGLNPALSPFPGLAARLFPAMAKLLFVNPFAPVLLARIARGQGEAGRFLKRATGSRIDAAGVAHYAALFGTPGHCASAITMMAEWDLDTLAADLPRLAAPALLLHGATDVAIPLSSVEAAAGRVPHAKIETMPGGHLMHEEHPAAVAARISAWMQREDG